MPHNNSFFRYCCTRSAALCSEADFNEKLIFKKVKKSSSGHFFHVKRQALWPLPLPRACTSLSRAAASFSGPSTFGETQHSVQPKELLPDRQPSTAYPRHNEVLETGSIFHYKRYFVKSWVICSERATVGTMKHFE